MHLAFEMYTHIISFNQCSDKDFDKVGEVDKYQVTS